jgi:hypothetical protein
MKTLNELVIIAIKAEAEVLKIEQATFFDSNAHKTASKFWTDKKLELADFVILN